MPAEQTGVASGMNANIRTIGGSVGAAVMASIVTADVLPSGLPREAGYTHGFFALMLVMLLGAVVALAIPRVARATIEEHLVGEPEHAELGILSRAAPWSATRASSRGVPGAGGAARATCGVGQTGFSPLVVVLVAGFPGGPVKPALRRQNIAPGVPELPKGWEPGGGRGWRDGDRPGCGPRRT